MGEGMSKLNLVVLRTKDKARLKDFYQGIFNVEFDEHEDHCSRHYGVRVGEVYLEVYQTKSEMGQLDGLGFEVRDLEISLGLAGNDYVQKEIESTPVGRVAMLKDPDGRVIYLSEKQIKS